MHQPYAIPFGRGSRSANGHVPNGPAHGTPGFRGVGRGHVAGPANSHGANPHGTIGPNRTPSPYPVGGHAYGLHPLTQPPGAPLTQSMSQGGPGDFNMDAMSQDFNFGDEYKSQSFYGGLDFSRDGYPASQVAGEFATQGAPDFASESEFATQGGGGFDTQLGPGFATQAEFATQGGGDFVTQGEGGVKTQALFRGGGSETQPASQVDFGAPSSQSFGAAHGDFMSQDYSFHDSLGPHTQAGFSSRTQDGPPSSQLSAFEPTQTTRYPSLDGFGTQPFTQQVAAGQDEKESRG